METPKKILNANEEKRIQQIVFHDRVKLLHDHLLTTSIPATLLCASILFIGLYHVENKSLIIGWYISLIVISLFRIYLLRLYLQTPENDYLHLSLFILGSTIAALSWSIAGTVLMPEKNMGDLILIIIIIAGITAGGSQTLQASRLANMLFLVTTILPLAIWLMLENEHVYVVLSIAVLGYLGFMMKLAQNGYTQLTNSMKLHHINIFLVKQLSEINTDLMNEVFERNKTQEKLDYFATHDPLTTIPNRHSFDLHFSQALEHAHSHARKFTVLFVDIDHFKSINDSYGHDIGDMLLYQVAMRLKEILRANDTIVRMGGDEFIILLEDLIGEEYIEKFTSRINRLFKTSFHVNDYELAITLSIGISIYPNDGMSKNTLLKKADIALYRAKEMGRNRAEFYRETFTYGSH